MKWNIYGLFKPGSLCRRSPDHKLSGKYLIEDDYFFKSVLKLQNEYDSIFKNDNDVFEGNGYHTFFITWKKGCLLILLIALIFSKQQQAHWVDVKNYLLITESILRLTGRLTRAPGHKFWKYFAVSWDRLNYRIVTFSFKQLCIQIVTITRHCQ